MGERGLYKTGGEILYKVYKSGILMPKTIRKNMKFALTGVVRWVYNSTQ